MILSTRVDEASPGNVWNRLNNNDVILVDVRERHEFEESRIPGSKHISKGVIGRILKMKFRTKASNWCFIAAANTVQPWQMITCKKWATKT